MHYPQHLAIIPDWNRTRAKKQGKTSMDGHLAWAKNSIQLFDYIFSSTPIKTVTARYLSTENLTGRSQLELEFLFKLYTIIADQLDEILTKHNINFYWVWSRNGLPKSFLEFLDSRVEKHVYPESEKQIFFCANYWGRDEILRGVKKATSELSLEQIQSLTEDEFSSYLDFNNAPMVDLVVRTKGDIAQRTSGFMAWWIGYAELYFTKTYFPAFNSEELEKALQWYNSIAEWRNFGK